MSDDSEEYFEPYVVVRVLGRGGMGTVYQAVHEKTNETVALKVISSELANEDRFRRRFLSEIETLVCLKHPNIVRVIGSSKEGILYYSMEYVDGGNLHERLRKEGRIPWEQLLNWSIEIASALKHAHDFGIIHRDLKPANLMITCEGSIKLTDFGISKLYGSQDATVVGSIIGTADFMPPEQASGEKATPRSDLYALGAICYACLTGHPPFGGRNVPEILFNIRYGTYSPVGNHARDIPKEFALLIDQLLSREPEKRPQNAYLVLNRLLALRAGLESSGSKLEKREPSTIEQPAGHDESQNPSSQASVADSSLSVSELGIEDTGINPPHSSSPNAPSVYPYKDATRFDLNPSSNRRKENRSEGNRETNEVERDAPRGTERSDMDCISPNEVTRDEGSFGENRQTQHSNSSIPSKKSNFKYVRESDRGKTSTTGDPVRPDQHKERWIEVAAILAALVLCCLGVAYFLQPPNPARLFAPIETALASGDDNRLLEIEDQVAAFESKFPNHPKIEVVHDAAREIDYLKRLRILERPTRKRLAEEKGGVFETLTEIHRWRVVDPVKFTRKLDAFLGAYPEQLVTDKERKWIDVARRIRDEIEANPEDRSGTSNRSRLEAHVDKLLKIEDLQQRQAALTAIVELYRSNEWADPVLERVDAALADLAEPRDVDGH